VYAQVTHLFNGAPDLLEDFKQFLPESAAQAKAAAARQAAEDATMLSSVRNESSYSTGGSQLQHTPRADPHRLPPLGNFAPTPSAGRDIKRKRGDRQGQIGGPSNFTSAGPDFGAASSSGRNGIVPNKVSTGLFTLVLFRFNITASVVSIFSFCSAVSQHSSLVDAGFFGSSYGLRISSLINKWRSHSGNLQKSSGKGSTES
jgi:hypothetical protein